MATTTKEGTGVSKGVLVGIIVVLLLLLLLVSMPGLRDQFIKDTDDRGRSGGSGPADVTVNGQPARTTTSGSSKETGSTSEVKVDVNEGEDGTSINIQIPEEITVDAEDVPSTDVGSLPGL